MLFCCSLFCDVENLSLTNDETMFVVKIFEDFEWPLRLDHLAWRDLQNILLNEHIHAF